MLGLAAQGPLHDDLQTFLGFTVVEFRDGALQALGFQAEEFFFEGR